MRMSLQAIREDSRFEYLGPDETFTQFAELGGIERNDFVAHRVEFEGRVFTIVVVPNRIWYRRKPMARFLKVKRRAISHGSKPILAPERFFRGALVGSLPGIPATPRRMEALGMIVSIGAAVIDRSCQHRNNHDAVGCMLHVMAAGAICMEVTRA